MVKYISLNHLLANTTGNVHLWGLNRQSHYARTHPQLSINFMKSSSSGVFFIFHNEYLFIKKMTAEQCHMNNHELRTGDLNTITPESLYADMSCQKFIIPELSILNNEGLANLYTDELYTTILTLLMSSGILPSGYGYRVDYQDIITAFETIVFNTRDEVLSHNDKPTRRHTFYTSHILNFNTGNMFNSTSDILLPLLYAHSRHRLFSLYRTNEFIDTINKLTFSLPYHVTDPNITQNNHQTFAYLKTIILDDLNKHKLSYFATPDGTVSSTHFKKDIVLPQDMKASIRLELNHWVDVKE